MTATDIMAIQAKQAGYKLKNNWNGKWSNFTDADILADCADAADPEKCASQMRQSPNYSGSKKDKVAQYGQMGFQFLSDLFGTIGQSTGSGATYTPTVDEIQREKEAKRKKTRNTLIIGGVVLAAAIGVGIYLHKRK